MGHISVEDSARVAAKEKNVMQADATPRTAAQNLFVLAAMTGAVVLVTLVTRPLVVSALAKPSTLRTEFQGQVVGPLNSATI